ncbi:phosphoserine phosphatase SerB [Psychromonas sp. MME2]|uniref:phosphoserine phosphatase SerB n=1 Tax=unclassified Psychromonas TaxID=2614957 RepID=UPI00339CEFFD
MNPIKKLVVQSNCQSLLKLKGELKQKVTGLDCLYYENGQYSQQLNSPMAAKASLIVMGEAFTCQQLDALLMLLAAQGVDGIAIHAPALIEKVTLLRLTLNNIPQTLKAALDVFVKPHHLDFALMDSFPDWQKPGLILMDMDSTTIQIECIDEIARLYGVGDEVAAVTAQAMQGKLDFNESLRTRVSKLKDAPITILKEVADSMPLMPGLEVLIAGVKKAGWKIAIASGGFNYFADRLKQDLGFDHTVANTLEVSGEQLTGNVLGEIVNAQVKARTLAELAKQYDIPMSQTVAIGDGANDLLMMESAAVGIAIHAKPIVQEKADVALNVTDLYGALALLSATLCPSSWA